MASPPLLFLRDVRLTFGATPLLTAASMSVSSGDRITLVGRNGSGKSTFLKIAAGLIEADGGEIFRQPGVTVRYLPQEPDLTGFASTLAYVEAGLGPGETPTARPTCWNASASPARRRRAACPAARRAARRWPGSWRPSRTS
ncbi:putative ABC transporter ATP-binding protein [Methylobrevis pamukkalensis]|uniref:Putative ABC transporter ATP-binding protein n=1 Tax=Methylobrevis pamukkalensis TaxID=1439726 RepID=A0A1E3GX15_9HYPH|nr:putative ABC transporter ATP-binding protein [Methylobrevis pamukkalensis]